MARILGTASAGELAASIAEARRLLLAGELVAFPTETVYGLGADATREDAVLRIFEAKGRPANNPVIVHLASWSSAPGYVLEWNQWAESLSKSFTSGPLTMVLRAAPTIARAVLAGGETVGIRVPAHPVALGLLGAVQRPLAAPSANRSNHVSPTTADAVEGALGDRIPAILDGGPCSVGIESTVLDLTGDVPEILRPGMIGEEELMACLGIRPRLRRREPGAAAEPLRSPGMMSRHYAPRIPLMLVNDFAPEGESGFQIDHGVEGSWGRNRIVLPADPVRYAQLLYRALLHAESSGASRILLRRPPQGPGWDAIHDRLNRAAG